jgi:hypothetical protein
MNYLQKSAREYDRGDRSEFRRIAMALRVLLHHRPPTSISLLEQAGLASTKLISTAPVIQWTPGTFHSTLAMLAAGPSGIEAVPKLGQSADRRLLGVNDWLNEIVIQDTHCHQFSRRYMIQSVANQDGGAHVDPALDEAYHRLVNEYTWGLVRTGPGSSQNIGGVEGVFLRQMAWEVLESFRGVVANIEPQPEPPVTGAIMDLSFGPFDPDNPPWGKA